MLEKGYSMTDWQPIETAPKDGTRIDLWAETVFPGYNGKRFINCRWGKNPGPFEDSKWLNLPHNPLNWAPTHWMLLPEPPQ